MRRFAPLTPEQWTPEQQKVVDAIIAGPRGAVGGPFPTWLRCPELAARLQELGEYIRFKRALPVKFVSIAILVTARHWQCQYEWDHHSKTAAKAGIPDQAIACILATSGRTTCRLTSWPSTTSVARCTATAPSPTRIRRRQGGARRGRRGRADRDLRLLQHDGDGAERLRRAAGQRRIHDVSMTRPPLSRKPLRLSHPPAKMIPVIGVKTGETGGMPWATIP